MSETGYSVILTSIYNTLTGSLSAIDFGDQPEDGNPFVQPKFTGGNPVLFPEEHDGREGESISSAGLKINNNFTTLTNIVTGLYSYVNDLDLLINSSSKYSVLSSDLHSSVQSGMCVYYDDVEGKYKPFTYDEQYTETSIGMYISEGILHNIYTHGYISNITTGLTAGSTYGLLSGGDAIPAIVGDSYSYICNESYIPIFRAVSDTGGIILSYSVTIPLTSTYI